MSSQSAMSTNQTLVGQVDGFSALVGDTSDRSDTPNESRLFQPGKKTTHIQDVDLKKKNFSTEKLLFYMFIKTHQNNTFHQNVFFYYYYCYLSFLTQKSD